MNLKVLITKGGWHKKCNAVFPNATMKIYGRLALLLFAIAALFSFDLKSNSGWDTAPSLYDTIVAMDVMWEDAYNNCKLDIMDDIMSDDLEFYHDQGGLMTSKQMLNDALRANICDKVKRSLKEGSLEVYPIKGYGAVEMGMHAFYRSKELPTQLHYAKFVHIWKREGVKWRITRVISLH